MNISKENYPPKIDNQSLINEAKVIRPDLIENKDFVIVTKSIAYYLHDTYRGNRRLKTKFRHVYHDCNEINSTSFFNLDCIHNHDTRKIFKLFSLQRMIEEKLLSDGNRNRKDRCHLFSWC